MTLRRSRGVRQLCQQHIQLNLDPVLASWIHYGIRSKPTVAQTVRNPSRNTKDGSSSRSRLTILCWTHDGASAPSKLPPWLQTPGWRETRDSSNEPAMADLHGNMTNKKDLPINAHSQVVVAQRPHVAAPTCSANLRLPPQVQNQSNTT